MFGFLKKLDEAFAQTEEGSRFADITSRARAAALCEYGNLTAVYLLPTPWGGSDEMDNILFLPPEAARRKEELDEKLWLRHGNAVPYQAQAKYRGESVIPYCIDIKIGRDFEQLIIW